MVDSDNNAYPGVCAAGYPSAGLGACSAVLHAAGLGPGRCQETTVLRCSTLVSAVNASVIAAMSMVRVSRRV